VDKAVTDLLVALLRVRVDTELLVLVVETLAPERTTPVILARLLPRL
jgi:hypothetical protein